MQTKQQTNREILRRYFGQPDTLPDAVRSMLVSAWGEEPPQLYAMADLDSGLRQTERWVILGRQEVALAQRDPSGNGRPEYTLLRFPRAAVRDVREEPGLSSTTVTLLGAPDDPPLAVFRFSYRQRGVIGAILFVLKQQTEGRELHPEEADSFYAETVAEPVRTRQGAVTRGKFSVVWRLVGYLVPYRWSFLVGLIAAAAFTALTLAPPMLTRNLIDDVINPVIYEGLAHAEAYRMGWIILGLLIGIYLLREVFLWLRLRCLTIVGEKVARDLRRNLYDHIHNLSIGFFSRNQTGSIISRVNSDTDRIWDFIAFGVAELLLSALMLVGLSVVLLFLDWKLALVLILPVPLIFAFIYYMGRKLHRIFLRIWHKWSEMTAVLSDTIPGIRVVQAFNQGDHERDRFNRRNEAVLDEAILVSKVWTSHWPVIFFALNVMTILVWAFALPRLLGGPDLSPSLTPGTFLAFLLYMGMFVGPLEQFGFLTRMINRSISSAHRVFEVLDTEPEVVSQPNAKKLSPISGYIRFEDVTFGYDPVRQILKGISFEVEPGEMIGLVGPSGAGKTTVVNLIARFFDVNSGSIQVDGEPIAALDLGHYRSQIGMVMQDPYLFHGSILENIRYGLHDANLEKVIGAARAANAHDFILKLPHGYDTAVGERGHTLSGGERQRISIARAILHNPRILILDEATSSVDTETERKIQEAIDRLVAGRTVFAIAHRLSTLARASRLFVMKDGLIVEMGKHEELLQNPDGVYTRLHKMQRELHEMYAV